jgi:hypothetical protein
MSEEIGAGVRILLERFKTNPEEMAEEYSKWTQLREAVFEHKERGVCGRFTRGLSAHEVDLLYEAFSKGVRQAFDSYVMKQVLDQDEEEKQPVGAYALSQGKRAVGGGGTNYNPYQNTIQPVNPDGSWQTVASQSSDTSITTAFKNALGIK